MPEECTDCFKIKNIFFELWVVVMQGGGVVGDVTVSFLCVFGLTILVLLDVFVVVQEKKEKKSAQGGGGSTMFVTGPVDTFLTCDSAKKVSGFQQRHVFFKIY